jgi:hypothetical protein
MSHQTDFEPEIVKIQKTIRTISRKGEIMKNVVSEYERGMKVSDIAKKHNITENEVRSYLKTQINWYSKSVADLSIEDQQNVLAMYNDKFSVLEISDLFQVPSPSIVKLLVGLGVSRVYHKGRRFEILKSRPFSRKHQEFIVGTMLGDGCIRKSGKLPRLCLVHSKKFENYFFWKMAQMDCYFNLWREQIHPRKKSTLLYTETLQHSGLVRFYEMFYQNGVKIVPKNLDTYMTPYALAIWFMDDGTLNSGTNHRIHTNGFNYDGQVELKSLLKRCFDIDCKIIQRRDGQYILSLNRYETVKLSKIIEPYVIPRMKYKLRLNLDRPSTTIRQTSKDDDIV